MEKPHGGWRSCGGPPGSAPPWTSPSVAGHSTQDVLAARLARPGLAGPQATLHPWACILTPQPARLTTSPAAGHTNHTPLLSPPHSSPRRPRPPQSPAPLRSAWGLTAACHGRSSARGLHEHFGDSQMGPSALQRRKLKPTGTGAGHKLAARWELEPEPSPHRAAACKSLETHTSLRSVPDPTPHPL